MIWKVYKSTDTARLSSFRARGRRVQSKMIRFACVLLFSGVLYVVSSDTSACCLSETPRNCYHALQLGNTVSGIYVIDPRDGLGSFRVWCDMQTDGGGWTVFQRRRDGSVDFYRGWDEYKRGFGALHGEFWLGLETPRYRGTGTWVLVTYSIKSRQTFHKCTSSLLIPTATTSFTTAQLS